jgi:hypothetical protein
MACGKEVFRNSSVSIIYPVSSFLPDETDRSPASRGRSSHRVAAPEGYQLQPGSTSQMSRASPDAQRYLLLMPSPNDRTGAVCHTSRLWVKRETPLADKTSHSLAPSPDRSRPVLIRPEECASRVLWERTLYPIRGREEPHEVPPCLHCSPFPSTRQELLTWWLRQEGCRE